MCYGSCCLCSGIGIISDLHQHHPDQHNLWSTKLSENDLPYMVLPGAIIVPLFLLPFQNSRTRRHLLMSHNTWSVDYVDLGGQLAVQIWIHTISDMFCSGLWSWPLSQTPCYIQPPSVEGSFSSGTYLSTFFSYSLLIQNLYAIKMDSTNLRLGSCAYWDYSIPYCHKQDLQQ